MPLPKTKMPKVRERIREDVTTLIPAPEKPEAPKHLTTAELEFVELMIKGITPTSAAEIAGFDRTEGRSLLKQKHIRIAIQKGYIERQRRLNITREDVAEVFLEAIDMARCMGDAQQMINGGDKLAKLCGFHNFEKKVSLSAAGASDLRNLSVEQLMALASGKSTLEELTGGRTIEGSASAPPPNVPALDALATVNPLGMETNPDFLAALEEMDVLPAVDPVAAKEAERVLRTNKRKSKPVMSAPQDNGLNHYQNRDGTPRKKKGA